MTTEQNVHNKIVDRFLNEATPKLVGDGNASVLTAEDLVLAVAELEITCSRMAAVRSCYVSDTQSEVFAPLFGRLNDATLKELIEALNVIACGCPNSEARTGAFERISDVISQNHSMLLPALADCFANTKTVLQAWYGWTNESARSCRELMMREYNHIDSSIIADIGVAPVWSWTGKHVVLMNLADPDIVTEAARQSAHALLFVRRGCYGNLAATVKGKLHGWDVRLGDWVANLPCMKTISQNVAITKPCDISLPHVIILTKPGVTYIKVTMEAGKGQMAILRAEIAGCGELCN